MACHDVIVWLQSHVSVDSLCIDLSSHLYVYVYYLCMCTGVYTWYPGTFTRWSVNHFIVRWQHKGRDL